jgi:hypothetical protein
MWRHFIPRLPPLEHSLLVIAAQMGGTYFCCTKVAQFVQPLLHWLQFLLVYTTMFIAFACSFRIVAHFIPARCYRCRGPAWCEYRDSIQYRCQDCGHVSVLPIYQEGD